jgi:hypothetical protein
MKKHLTLSVLGGLILVLLAGACSPAVIETATPTAAGATVVPSDTAAVTLPVEAVTGTPATATPGGTVTPPVPAEVCGFCVDTTSQVVLIAPGSATFQVEPISADATALPAPGITCNNVETVGDKQVLLCGGPQNLSFKLKLCDSANNCSETQVNLPACPLGTQVPNGTATETVTVTGSPTGAVTVTGTPAAGGGTVTITPTAPAGATTTPTASVTPTP